MLDPKAILPAEFLRRMNCFLSDIHSASDDDQKRLLIFNAHLEIVNRNLSLEQFIALAKVKEKEIWGQNIFHLTARYSRQAAGCFKELFNSASLPLSKDQIVEILSEKDKQGNNFLEIFNNKSQNTARTIIQQLDLPTELFKSMWLTLSSRSVVKRAQIALMNNDMDDFKEDLLFYKITSAELLNEIKERRKVEIISRSVIKLKTFYRIVDIFNQLKTSPEEYISVFSMAGQKMLNIMPSCDELDHNSPLNPFYYFEKIKSSPNSEFSEEKECFDKFKAFFETQGDDFKMVFSPGLNAITEYRKNRLETKRVIRRAIPSVHSKVIPLNSSHPPLAKAAR
jgi:hypothetical protein